MITDEFVEWKEQGSWFIGTVTGNFRKVETKFGEKFVTNIQLTEDKKDSLWLDVGGKVKGGTKPADFLESLGFVYKNKDEFNPLELDIAGKELLCLWGVILLKGKQIRDGIIRFKRLD